MSHCSISGADPRLLDFPRVETFATLSVIEILPESAEMKKIVAALALSAALAAPASAQDGLNMGALAANGPLIAAGVGFLTIIIVGANADSTTTTTTLRRN